MPSMPGAQDSHGATAMPDRFYRMTGPEQRSSLELRLIQLDLVYALKLAS